MMRASIVYLLIAMLLVCNDVLGQQYSSRYTNLQTQLATGWNTWSYGSMTSHVLLPEALALNIHVRQAFIGTPYDPDFYLGDLTVDKSNLVKPIAHTSDGAYTEMLIEQWKGNTIRIQSAAKGKEIVILITPVVKSSTRYYVELGSGILWNRQGVLRRSGQTITADFENNNDYIIRSTAPVIEVAHPYTSPYLITQGDTSVAFYTGNSVKTLAEVTAVVDAAKQEYESYALHYGELADGFRAIQTVLGWNTLYDADKNRVITPVSRGWNEAWHGYVLFEWDTYFAALLFSLSNKDLAYSNAIAVTKGRMNFGQVGFLQWPHGERSTQSQPPVGAMVCWTIYEKYKEQWFLEEVYETLLEWNRWWMKHRVNQGFLTWGAGWKTASLQNIMLESGLDNSPMYEDATISVVGDNSLLNLADVGLNSLYVADCQYLARIASALGKKSDEKELLERARKMTEKMTSLWDEQAALFLNRNLQDGKLSHRLSPTLFFPMLAHVASPKQAKRMISEHFYNRQEFYGDYILPSIARNDKSFDNNYWRGAIWGPMNFLVYSGLRQYDKAAAAELADKSYELLMTSWRGDHRVFENINSINGANTMADQVNSDPYYHWGALMGLMKFMEEGKY